MAKILLLDLDGTIRRTKSGKTFINEPEDQEPIEGSIEALDRYHADGYRMIGITNQGGVAAGQKFLQDAIDEQIRTLELFPQLSYIYFCPDFEGKFCYLVSRENLGRPVHTEWAAHWSGSFRKPNPGMILAALFNIQNGKNPIEDCLFVGDRPEDEAAARNAGVRFQWADRWREVNPSAKVTD
ncbi:HAD-IIIA family hydrolase [Pannus brasiliensis CCIBt3594]|uniref:HAD-IIIA family hydrolase n=1 Tax=Pannus brasiliensis CCIBt3594 TaxID=1427578 RepID=A0AAW9R197_9CHRO